MAGKKRQTDIIDGDSTKSKRSSTDRVEKRRKKSSIPETATAKPVVTATSKPSTPAKSLLSNEEKSFPRGGGSVLTPLEHKQIQNKAARDVLFEQSGTKRSAPEHSSDDEIDSRQQEISKPSKKRKKTKGAVKATEKPREPKLDRVEGLSYRRLVPGSVVLGQITQITSRDIALALPNNLTGYVPLTSISEPLTKRVQRLLERDDEGSNDEEEEANDFEDIELKKLFSVGQYLRAYVTANTDVSGNKTKRRIELSIKPQHANFGLSLSDCVANSMIQAAVVSVEDRGLVMDIGLEGESAEGFVLAKDLGADIELNEVEEGTVFLCLVTGATTGAKTILKLSLNIHKDSGPKASMLLNAPSVNAYTPGVATEMLITDVTTSDLRGKIMGLLDVTADHFHSGYYSSSKDLEKTYKIGSRVKVRIIFTLPKGDSQRVGVSVLPCIVGLSPLSLQDVSEMTALQSLPLSSIVEDASVIKVERKLGLFMDVHVAGYPAFAHISQLSDSKIDSLSDDSGAFKLGSKHRARVIGFNPIDGLFLVSLEKHILDQPFLRIEDVPVGNIVKGKVEQVIINERGIGGILVNLADGISGLAPTMHMSDVPLQHPERKFREGLSVTARVLSTDPIKRRIRLTLKKGLVNSPVEPWISYDQISVGGQSPGTIVNIVRDGAVVQFYGNVRAFLPVSEMSETYIKDPQEHFRLGQTVNVRVLSVDTQAEKMIVSCKDPEASLGKESAFDKLAVGQIVSGTVIEVSPDSIRLELDAGIKGILKPSQLSDGSEKKNASALKQIRAGQKLSDCLILEKDHRQLSLTLSRKPSLLKASRNGDLLTSFAQVETGKKVDGFVRNIAGDNIFVQFGGGLVGLIHKSELPQELVTSPDFGLAPGKSISAFILNIKPEQQRFFLTSKENAKGPLAPARPGAQDPSGAIMNAVDGTSTSINDYHVGKQTKGRVRSVKRSQIHVMLADGVEGRVCVSEAFDSWDDMQDKQHPLRHHFKSGDIIDVRVLGEHLPKAHKYLPITHNLTTKSVFELSAKTADQSDEVQKLSLDKINVGDEHVVFINNHKDGHAFVNLTPNIRGVVPHSYLTDDMSLLLRVTETFPVGSALKAIVKSVDLPKARLLLSAVPSTSISSELVIEKGKLLPGLVTKVSKHGINVRLGESVIGFVPNYEIADDYDQIDLQKNGLSKHSAVRVCVLQEAEATLSKGTNALSILSMRPSVVLSSSLPVKDRPVHDIKHVKVNDVYRGFVNKVTDVGIFVALGPEIYALVREADISDEFVKDWKSKFEPDQLIKGKIIFVDHDTGRLKMSLKRSHLEKDYVPELTWNDVKQGQVVTGKIRKVMDFGVIIVVDNSTNVSGLCHENDMADNKIADWKNKFQVDDKVKAVVKKLDAEKKKLQFSLKAAALKAAEKMGDDADSDDGLDDVSMISDEVELDGEEDADDDDLKMPDLDNVKGMETDEEEQVGNGDLEVSMEDGIASGIAQKKNLLRLGGNGFNWEGDIEADDDNEQQPDGDEQPSKKKKRRKPEIQIDRTGDLDKYGPQSVADFERLLLGQPNSSELWIQYMAFQLQLNEVDKARAIAERALNTINMREETEKTNVWTALLNLENSFGSAATLDAAFARAQEFVDKADVHSRLASILIETGKHSEADALFGRMTGIKALAAADAFWLNYATFLMTTLAAPDRARALNRRALQALDESLHLRLTARFAALEFRSPHGDPERGRTLFEGLLDTYPRRWDLWDQFVDLERARGEAANVRALFERMVAGKVKPRRAKYVFKRWMEYEEQHGDAKMVERVKKLAEEWVEKRKGEKESDE